MKYNDEQLPFCRAWTPRLKDHPQALVLLLHITQVADWHTAKDPFQDGRLVFGNVYSWETVAQQAPWLGYLKETPAARQAVNNARATLRRAGVLKQAIPARSRRPAVFGLYWPPMPDADYSEPWSQDAINNHYPLPGQTF